MNLSFFGAGLIGGLLRGGMGLFKYTTSYKDVKIRPYYFGGMVILTGVIGWVSAWVARDALRIFLDLETVPVSFALIAGYAGGDFIENIFKIALKEPNLFEVGEKIKEINEIVKEESPE
jgi:hypothetical protein